MNLQSVQKDVGQYHFTNKSRVLRENKLKATRAKVERLIFNYETTPILGKIFMYQTPNQFNALKIERGEGLLSGMMEKMRECSDKLIAVNKKSNETDEQILHEFFKEVVKTLKSISFEKIKMMDEQGKQLSYSNLNQIVVKLLLDFADIFAQRKEMQLNIPNWMQSDRLKTEALQIHYNLAFSTAMGEHGREKDVTPLKAKLREIDKKLENKKTESLDYPAYSRLNSGYKKEDSVNIKEEFPNKPLPSAYMTDKILKAKLEDAKKKTLEEKPKPSFWQKIGNWFKN